MRGWFFYYKHQAPGHALFTTLCCKTTLPLAPMGRDLSSCSLFLSMTHPLVPKVSTSLGTLQIMKWSTLSSTYRVSESTALRGFQSDLLITLPRVWHEKPYLFYGIPDPREKGLERINALHSNFPLLERDIGEEEKEGKEKIYLRVFLHVSQRLLLCVPKFSSSLI